MLLNNNPFKSFDSWSLIRCCPVCKFVGHVARLVAFGVLLQEVGQEEQFQHHKDDEQLDEDDGPQRPAQAHVPESVDVEVVCPI